MKTLSKLPLIAGGLLATSVAFADSGATTIKTRSIEAAQADLIVTGTTFRAPTNSRSGRCARAPARMPTRA